MNKVEFSYNDDKYIVQCNNDDKMSDIIARFLSKAGKDRKNIAFLYNGSIINEDLAFSQCANRLDRSQNYMNVVVVEGQSSNEDSVNLKKSDYIICPQCKENAYLSIKDFILSITGCKSEHKTDDLEFKEFDNTQLIDQSKIACDKCHFLKGDNEFFICLKCQQKFCSRCYEEHDTLHKDYIKNYEEAQFYCKFHYGIYDFYCTDCKKDLCALCKEEHKDHKYITYDSILPDYNNIKEKELQDTKGKIYQLKTIVNGMIYQLNQLNKSLDIYFEIYYNIVSNYDFKKRNYNIIQNINNMKNYNNNYFLLNITEIIKNDNLKAQFTDIISLQTKMDYKRLKKNKEIEEKANKNEIIINDSGDDNNKIYNPSEDKYEHFNINNMKELQSFTVKNDITQLYILNDGRILTNQNYYDETGENFSKLCVYTIKNGLICDINVDFEDLREFFQMEDGNIIIRKKNEIQMLKIQNNSIIKEWTFDKMTTGIKKFLENKFLLYIKTNEEIIQDKNRFFRIPKLFKTEYELYTYDKGKLIFDKNITKIYKDTGARDICQINENEYVFYASQKGKIYGTNDYLIFYDIQKEVAIKKLKVGNGENSNDMILINKDNLIISGEYPLIILIDVKTRQIKNKFKYDISFNDLICLNDNIFLNPSYSSELHQYEFEDLNIIKLKEERKIKNDLISKYPGNKLIIYYDRKISIYG